MSIKQEGQAAQFLGGSSTATEINAHGKRSRESSAKSEDSQAKKVIRLINSHYHSCPQDLKPVVNVTNTSRHIPSKMRGYQILKLHYELNRRPKPNLLQQLVLSDLLASLPLESDQ
jgi:hypothetical protein